ncbi:LPXTG cell wall anchor domain-containing protein [Streptococcus iners]|uniref:LPXTG cell wall anchor domain-containing protein n=1 Tax=Streptococcus iners TaxID=3028084 RepID=A0AA96VUT5_9STRE|nr:LPXTG cell wall anchor domain-containing protein [Streptococcus sp. 29887]MCK4025940.1 LPXTG cell wall anchor domain-containing protein [Streptococcus suis]WNY51674.1 LPXTG cell wall anchor domain-containing protein [Streptococcus sp. 29887]
MKIKRSSSQKQVHKWTRLGIGLLAVAVLGGLVEPVDFKGVGSTEVYANEQVDPALEARKAEIKTMIQSYRDLVGQIKALNPSDYTEESWNRNYEGDVRIYLGAQSIATAYNDDLTFSSLSLDGVDNHQTLNELNATYLFGYQFVENAIPILKQAMADLVPVSKSLETPTDQPIAPSSDSKSVETTANETEGNSKSESDASVHQVPKTATFVVKFYNEDGSESYTNSEQVTLYPDGAYTFDFNEIDYSLKEGQDLTYHYDEVEDGATYTSDQFKKASKSEEGVTKTVRFTSYDDSDQVLSEEVVNLNPGDSYTFSFNPETHLSSETQKLEYSYEEVTDGDSLSLYLVKKAKKSDDQSVTFDVITRLLFHEGGGVGDYPIEHKSITLKFGESITLAPPVYEDFELYSLDSELPNTPKTLTNDGKSEIKGMYSFIYAWKGKERNELPIPPKDYTGKVLSAVDHSYLLKVVHEINGEFRALTYYSIPSKNSVAPELLVNSNYGQLSSYVVSDFYGSQNNRRQLTLSYQYPKNQIPENTVTRIPLAQGVWPTIVPASSSEKVKDTSPNETKPTSDATTTTPSTLSETNSQPKQEGETTTTVGKPVNTSTSPVEPSTDQTTNPVSEEIKPTVKEQLEPSKVTSLDSYKDVTETSSSVTVRVRGEDVAKVASLSVTKENDPAVFAKLPQGLAEHQVDLYDIKTLDTRGQFVQITEEATVTLPVAAGKEIEKVIYFLASTGAVEELPFTVDKATNQVSFVVSHFSHYGIVYQASKPVSQVQPGSVSQSVQPVVAPSIQSNQTGSSSHTQTKGTTVKPASTSQSQAKTLPATGEVSSVLHLTGLGLLGLVGLVVKRRSRKSS